MNRLALPVIDGFGLSQRGTGRTSPARLMARHPRPLAVGLLHTSAHASQPERTRARIALTLAAAEEGYALIETYETGGNPLREDAAFGAIEELATRLDADAVIHAGNADLVRVHDVAERLHLTIISGARTRR